MPVSSSKKIFSPLLFAGVMAIVLAGVVAMAVLLIVKKRERELNAPPKAYTLNNPPITTGRILGLIQNHNWSLHINASAGRRCGIAITHIWYQDGDPVISHWTATQEDDYDSPSGSMVPQTLHHELPNPKWIQDLVKAKGLEKYNVVWLFDDSGSKDAARTSAPKYVFFIQEPPGGCRLSGDIDRNQVNDALNSEFSLGPVLYKTGPAALR